MQNPKNQSSSAKRKQLHPKKQIIQSMFSRKNDNTSANLEASLISSPQEIPKMELVPNNTAKLPISIRTNFESSVIKFPLTNAEISKGSDKHNTVTNELFPKKTISDMKLTTLDKKATSGSMTTTKNESSINIDTMKCSLKQKLDVVKPDSKNIEQSSRVTLTQKKIIAEQKKRKFFVDASLHTTIVRNINKRETNGFKNLKGSLQERMAEINIRECIDNDQANLSKKKIKETCNNDEKKKELKHRKIMNGTHIDNTEKNNNKPSTLLIKKILITPSTNNKSKENPTQQADEFDAVIEICMDKDESSETNTIASKVLESISKMKKSDPIAKNTNEHVSLKINKQATLKETDEKFKNTSSVINLKDTGEFVTCLQTVQKHPSLSAIKAVASIRKLGEVSPTKLREESKNILGYNIDMINYINGLTEASKKPKVSINNLEDALVFALGKKPRSITIIKKPKEIKDTNSKPFITYIDKLDSALNSTLGSNSKLAPFVKKLIKSSVSNLVNTNALQKTSLKDNSVRINIFKNFNNFNFEVEVDLFGFQSFEIPKNRNFKFRIALNNFMETYFKLHEKIEQTRKLLSDKKKIIKPQINRKILENRIVKHVVPKNINKIKIISVQKGETQIKVKPSQIDRKNSISTCSAKPLFLKRYIKPPISNSEVALINSSVFAHHNSGTGLDLSSCRPVIVNRIVKVSGANQVTANNSSPKKLSMISPATLIETPNKPNQIIVKKIINNINGDLKSIKEGVVETKIKKLEISGQQTTKIDKNSKNQSFEILNLKTGQENSTAVFKRKGVDNGTNTCRRGLKEEGNKISDLMEFDKMPPLKRPKMINAKSLERFQITPVKNPITTTNKLKAGQENTPAVLKTKCVDNGTNTCRLRLKEEGNKISNLMEFDEMPPLKRPKMINAKYLERFQKTPKKTPITTTNELKTGQENSPAVFKRKCVDKGTKTCRLGLKEDGNKISDLMEFDGMPPLKRPKMINAKSLECFQKTPIKNPITTTNELKTVLDFSLLQASVKKILNSYEYNQLISLNTNSIPDESSSKAKYEIKGLSSFAAMHETIQSILESPGYKKILALAKDVDVDPIKPFMPIKETESSFDLNEIDLATLKSSPTVPDTLLPLLDKEESEEVYEKYIIEHVWNENKNQDISFFDNPNLN